MLAHRLEQFDAVLPAAEEGEEIRLGRFFGGIETEDAGGGGIAGHDLAIGVHDEHAGEILRDGTAVALVRFVSQVWSILHHGAREAGVAVDRGSLRARISSRPPATKT